MADSTWTLNLVLRERAELEALAKETEMPGAFSKEERVATFFSASIAPADSSHLKVRLNYDGREWFCTLKELGCQAPLAVRTLDEIEARTPWKPEQREILAASTVALIGMGSVGSAISSLLARSSIGTLMLLDPDRLSIENLSRHIGELADVGRLKTTIAGGQAQRADPRVSIIDYSTDLFAQSDEEVQSTLSRASILVATTDQQRVQFLVNRWAVRLKIPAVFVGCYDEARGGEVFVWLPDKRMPCYACLRGGLAAPIRTAGLAYTVAEEMHEFAGEPAMYANIMQIAASGAQFVIAVLLRSAGSALGKLIDVHHQYLLIGSGQAEGFYRFRRAFDTFFQPLSGPRKGCIACGSQQEQQK